MVVSPRRRQPKKVVRAVAHVGISEFGSLGVSTPHLVMVLFSSFLVYTVAIFVVTPHSFVTLHHHELVRPRLGRDFPHKRVYGPAGLLRIRRNCRRSAHGALGW